MLFGFGVCVLTYSIRTDIQNVCYLRLKHSIYSALITKYQHLDVTKKNTAIDKEWFYAFIYTWICQKNNKRIRCDSNLNSVRKGDF